MPSNPMCVLIVTLISPESDTMVHVEVVNVSALRGTNAGSEKKKRGSARLEYM
jgi:hypothetical protein